jgi:hypothetical protein
MSTQSNTRRSRPRRWRPAVALLGSVALAAAGSATLLGPGTSSASSHREAPLISGDPKADNTDLYAFVSPDKPDTVTLIANWIPFEEPNGGPNFYPFADDARYNIKIDNNGDAEPDVTYAWVFRNHYRSDETFLYNTGPVTSLTDATLNFSQTYDLTVTTAKGTKTLVHNGKVAPSDVGKASIPDYAPLRDQATVALPGGGMTYAGQADDPFFLDLRVFDLLYGATLKEAGHDTLDGFNVNTLAIQVPTSVVTLKSDPTRNPVIGVWSTTDRRSTSVVNASGVHHTGTYVQVSRLGNPLVNEVVVPLKYKDAFNSISPSADHTIAPVVAKVTDPILPHLIQSIYGVAAPATPRNDLVEIFLTGICKACGPIKADLNSQQLNKDVAAKTFVPAEELRLNTAVAPATTPNRLGVLGQDLAGFPNGRRLGDDVIDIAVQSVEGAAQSGTLVPALAKGDGVDANDVPFGDTFPYLALPHDGSVNQASAASASAATSTAPSSAKTGFGSTASRAPLLATGSLALAVMLVIGGFVGLRRRTAA